MKKGGELKLKNAVEGIQGAAFMVFALLTPFLRPWRTRWGATDAEVKRKLPGDELMPHPKWGFTHAVTIKAPVAKVWPWIVQMGQGRGGFYSYEFLENLVGCDIHNADRIIPEFQNLKVGENIKLHPKAPVPVAIVAPNHALVLHYEAETPTTCGTRLEEPTQQKPFSTNWMWVLEKVDERTTRHISRWSGDYGPGMKNRLSYGPCFMEPIEFAMSRKMLLGIKKRAESGKKV
jgi:hypothetical protein